jgi:NodT family efflux transporter outer membrane factor (OMF) lipoprotein
MKRKHATTVGCGMTAVGLIFLAGCTVGPDYAAPTMTTQASFVGSTDGSHDAPGAVAGVPTGVGQSPADLSSWWTAFGDKTLTGLISTALEANHDLRLAVARLEESRALVGVARADKGVQIDANADARRTRASETTTNGGRFESDEDDEYSVGASASWEIDFFGRVKRSVEAATADLDAAEATVGDARVLVAADVAQRYVDLRGAQERLAVNLRAVAVREQTLDLAKALVKSGLAADLDVAQAEAELAQRRADTPTFEAQIRQNAYAIAVLCGKSPADMLDLAQTAGSVPVAPAALATGAPADLLMRRPDLRAAERRVAAATARIGVATADLYPRFSLLGSFSLQAANPADLYDLDSRTYSFGPGVTWSVFTNGRVRSNIAAADARTKASLVEYEKAVLIAIREAEDALIGLSSERRRFDALGQSVEANKRAVDLAEALYKTGLSALTPVLDNQRRYYDAQDQAVQSRTAVTRNAVSVYKALGGGWTPVSRASALANP